MCRRLSCLSPCLSEVKTQGEDKPYPMKNPGGKAGGSYAYYKRYGRNEVLLIELLEKGTMACNVPPHHRRNSLCLVSRQNKGNG